MKNADAYAAHMHVTRQKRANNWMIRACGNLRQWFLLIHSFSELCEPSEHTSNVEELEAEHASLAACTVSEKLFTPVDMVLKATMHLAFTKVFPPTGEGVL